MNIFFILFLALPILSFIGVFLLTDSLIYAIITLLIIDLVFTVLFVKRQKDKKR
ncbi:hypothetical protein [Salinicoccus sp. HZC-1]|uniref:hypothetical protein n=1 Tax=Salinicoccus sp. HZC-1 TaxID=3385497 RepID=UPI00398A51F2